MIESGRCGSAVAPLDVVYLFQHSRSQDEELRYSLRSVAANLPFVRKVWIFGDRPQFLSGDAALVEHVPHEYIAPLLGYKTPLKSDLLMLLLASLLPEVAFDFVRFSDDYIVLRPLSRTQLGLARALEDLNLRTQRGTGKWKESLWRTFEMLKRYGYAGYNFESHVPMPLTKKMVFEAAMAFRPFQSEERFGGIVSATAIYNYALAHQGLEFVWLAEEKSRAGFYGSCPSLEQLDAGCRGKLFLNFDDAAYGAAMRSHLDRLFPGPCKYEATWTT